MIFEFMTIEWVAAFSGVALSIMATVIGIHVKTRETFARNEEWKRNVEQRLTWGENCFSEQQKMLKDISDTIHEIRRLLAANSIR